MGLADLVDMVGRVDLVEKVDLVGRVDPVDPVDLLGVPPLLPLPNGRGLTREG